MSLNLIELNVNSSYESIAIDKPDGQIRTYLLGEALDKKLAPIIELASRIKESLSCDVFLAVKVSFGSRSKRLEIAFKIKSTVYFVKISNPQKCDAAALELEQTIRFSIINSPEIDIRGLVMVEGNLSEFDAETFTKIHANHVIIHPMSIDLHRIVNGVSDKSSPSRKNSMPA